MTSDFAIELVRRAVVLTLTVSAPLLVTALVVGVVVSLIQTITQIQEQTLTFVPKILIMAGVLLLVLPWVLDRLVTYLGSVFSTLSSGSLIG